MTDPRYQQPSSLASPPSQRYRTAAQFSALPSVPNRYSSHSHSHKHYISASEETATESEDNCGGSEASSSALAAAAEQPQPQQPRWRAFPATTVGRRGAGASGSSNNNNHYQQQQQPQQPSLPHGITATRGGGGGGVAGRWNPLSGRSAAVPQQPVVEPAHPDPELVPLPSEDSLQSAPSTEVTSNVHRVSANSSNSNKQSAVRQWRNGGGSRGTAAPPLSSEQSGLSSSSIASSNSRQPTAARTWRRPAARSPPPPLPEAHSVAARSRSPRGSPATVVSSPAASSLGSPDAPSRSSPTSTPHAQGHEAGDEPAFPDSPAATVAARKRYPVAARSWIKPSPPATATAAPESANGGAAVGSNPPPPRSSPRASPAALGGAAQVGGTAAGGSRGRKMSSSPSKTLQQPQSQPPPWKQQLLKQRSGRLSLRTPPPPQQQPKEEGTVPETRGAETESGEEAAVVTEAAAATPPPSGVRKTSLVSERLAKFGGGGGSGGKVSPQPTSSAKKYGGKPNYLHPQQQRKLVTAPSDETTTASPEKRETEEVVPVVVRSPEYTTKTAATPPTTTSGKQSSSSTKEEEPAAEPPKRSPVYGAGQKSYVPPLAQKSFVPVTQPAPQPRPKFRSPAKKWTPPHHQPKSNKTSELEIVVPDGAPAPRGKPWVSPRSKRLHALAATADGKDDGDDGAIGEVVASQSSTEPDVALPQQPAQAAVAVAKTPERRRTPYEPHPPSSQNRRPVKSPQKQQQQQPPISSDAVEPADEASGGGGGVIETPGKISVKDMKAKLWGGSGEKLKVSPVRAPAPPKIGTVDPTASSHAHSPPRSTSQSLPAAPAATAAPASPPTSRIAKGLIDVSTPQGLAPPVRNSTAARPNSSNRKNNPLPWMLKPHPDAAAAASAGKKSEDDGAQADLAMPVLPGGSSGGGDNEEPPKLVDIVSEEEHVEVTLGDIGDEHELLGKSSETMESEGTEPPSPPPQPPQQQQTTRNGRSFKANVAKVLSPPGGDGDPTPVWVKRRLEMEEEKKSSEPADSPERSVNNDTQEESFQSPPSSPRPMTTSQESSPKETIEPVNLEDEISSPHHNRSPSLGDEQVDEVARTQQEQQQQQQQPSQGNADSVLSPPSPPPIDTGRLPLSGRPSSDESDFPLPPPSPPRRSSTSPAKQHKPPLSPTTVAKQQNAANFVETIDCPPSDDVEDEYNEEEVDGPESFVATPPRPPTTPRSPMSPRGEKVRPWTKDANSLSPESWQRCNLENDESSFRNSSRENVSPVKSNVAHPSDHSSPAKSANPNQTTEVSPGSSLSQMAAESIHALDFERVERELPITTLSEDGSESLISNGGATASSASVPAVVPPEFRKTIADVDEDKPMDSGDDGRGSPRIRVAERAKALAKWNGGLGEPLKGDEDDEDDNVNGEQKGIEELPVSPIRRQGSGDGFDAMSPRLNHRGVPIDDWHRNKSFNSNVSYDQNSDFNASQFDDSITEEKDWSMDDGGGGGEGGGGGGTDSEAADETLVTSAASEVPTLASSVKPIGKPRRDSEPRKQKDRRKRKESRAQSPAVHKAPEAVVDDPFSLDAMANENEMNNKSTTFEFDPFGDTFGEKVEFTETTEFTEASDFFGTANAFENFFPQDFVPRPIEEAVGLAESKETTSSSAVSRNNMTAGTRSGSGSLNRIDTDFWSYDADTSTFHDDDTARHVEI